MVTRVDSSFSCGQLSISSIDGHAEVEMLVALRGAHERPADFLFKQAFDFLDDGTDDIRAVFWCVSGIRPFEASRYRRCGFGLDVGGFRS